MASEHLFLNRTTNGDSSVKEFSTPITVWLEGTYNGCTITLSVARESGGTFVPIKVSTTPEVVPVIMTGKFYLKATVASAGGSTSVTVATT